MQSKMSIPELVTKFWAKAIKFRHKGTSYSIPAREIVHTVFNHSSFHRGQLAMMRQLGITDIAQTDYIEWVRLRATNKLEG
jgi:uncharacterized damage-inducible protein DinB